MGLMNTGYIDKIQSLSDNDLEIYLKLMKRAQRQINILFVTSALCFVVGAIWLWAPGLIPVLSTGAVTWPLWLMVVSNVTALVSLICRSEVFPICVTCTGDFTTYRWKHRHSPEWMYRRKFRLGFMCVLYGDALQK